jgi:hypothetical protein
VPPADRLGPHCHVLDRLVAEHGTPPTFIRCDNGQELTANGLRDWCRFSRGGTAYIKPGSPWQDPYFESFGSRIRDEFLAVELFSFLAEAQVLIEDWRHDYNHHQPHSAPEIMTSNAFVVGYREAHLAAAPAARVAGAVTRPGPRAPLSRVACSANPTVCHATRAPWPRVADEASPAAAKSIAGSDR